MVLTGSSLFHIKITTNSLNSIAIWKLQSVYQKTINQIIFEKKLFNFYIFYTGVLTPLAHLAIVFPSAGFQKINFHYELVENVEIEFKTVLIWINHLSFFLVAFIESSICQQFVYLVSHIKNQVHLLRDHLINEAGTSVKSKNDIKTKLMLIFAIKRYQEIMR